MKQHARKIDDDENMMIDRERMNSKIATGENSKRNEQGLGKII
jgi:hypothetical protein